MQVASFLIHKILTPESIRDLITILEIVKKIIIILTKTWSLQPQIWHECPRWASDMRTSTNQTNVVIVYPSWKIALKELIIFNSFEVNMVKRLCLEDSCTQHYFSSKSFFQIGIILCYANSGISISWVFWASIRSLSNYFLYDQSINVSPFS